MKTTPVAILVRVSTDKQTTDRQKSELLAYADSKGFSVVEVVEETVSGRASTLDRTGLKRIEELAEEGKKLKRFWCMRSVESPEPIPPFIALWSIWRNTVFPFTGTRSRLKRSSQMAKGTQPPQSC
jgi:hypothetical protein